MPVSADLPALIRRSSPFALLALLAFAPAAWSADAGTKPKPRPASSAKAAAATEASALTAQGQRVSGDPGFSAGALVVGPASVSWDALVALDLPGERPRWLDQGLILADGQVLRGVARSLQQDKLDFAADLLGARSLPAEGIAAIALGTVDAGDPLAGITGFTGAVLINGDRVAGKVSFINEVDVGIDTGRRMAQVPRARVRLLCLRDAVPAAGLWLRTVGGDRLRASAGGDAFSTVVGGGDPVKLPLAAVAVAWGVGDKLSPLERLKPSAITRSPQFDEDIAISINRQRDGGPLAIGDRRFERGIACRAGCELVWSDLGAYGTLVGEVGVVDGPGTATCRVVVDGKAVFDSGPITGGAAPRPFSVAVSGAHEVRLIADPGPGGDTAGDRVIWGWPTLVK